MKNITTPFAFNEDGSASDIQLKIMNLNWRNKWAEVKQIKMLNIN